MSPGIIPNVVSTDNRGSDPVAGCLWADEASTFVSGGDSREKKMQGKKTKTDERGLARHTPMYPLTYLAGGGLVPRAAILSAPLEHLEAPLLRRTMVAVIAHEPQETSRRGGGRLRSRPLDHLAHRNKRLRAYAFARG